MEIEAGGETGNMREKANGPAFVMTGCTYSQHAVARMMTRMRNLDDVTDVKLAKSAKREETSTNSAGAPAAGSAAAAGTPTRKDCVGSSRVTKFDMLVGFGGSHVTTAAVAAAAVPGSRRLRLPRQPQQPPGKAATAAAGGEHDRARQLHLDRHRVVGGLGAIWFMALSPKREEAAKLDKDIAAAQQALDRQAGEGQFAQAQLSFPHMYASLGRLGKAVPPDEDVPSLLVQLNHAAAQARVDFRSVELKLSTRVGRRSAGCRREAGADSARQADRRSGRGATPRRAPPERTGRHPPPRAGSSGVAVTAVPRVPEASLRVQVQGEVLRPQAADPQHHGLVETVTRS